ncbi:O-antigen ligase family protein [Pseudonocardia charpentierae]|uniref:O-antigen ligase family protein n=1 Tax=Pseudonocardia charpentierae TaxID=3075545 RepID=A0ABU2NHR5_9PSEU|nr:O-antigen ligase family protein [Pseudonocardia sp. DSM 45834]MDT0353508.1 O-antigen ligase family protein [Pseudonocardia sp. DSM 45834]
MIPTEPHRLWLWCRGGPELRPLPGALLPAFAVLALAATCGLVSGGVRVLAMLVLGLVATVVIAVALACPVVALAVVVVIEASNASGVYAQLTPLPLFYLGLGLGTTSLVLALRDPECRRRLTAGRVAAALLLYVVYLASLVPAYLTTQDPVASGATISPLAGQSWYFVMVLLLALVSARPWTIARSIVVPLAGLCLLGLVNQALFGGAATFGGFANVGVEPVAQATTPRHSGPLPDSNFWGRHLVIGLPLAAALVVHALKGARRRSAVGWSAAGALILMGIYLTQSRGTFLAALAAVVVLALACGLRARWIGMIFATLSLSVFVPGVGDRLISVVRDVGSNALYAADPSIIGRTAAQEAAWAMFRDNPFFGVGPQAYASLISHYGGQVGTPALIPPSASHNLYAGIAAEYGAVGLLGWAVTIGGFLALAVMSVIRLAAAPAGPATDPDRILAAAALAALVAWSVASIFLHMAYFRVFLLVPVLIAAVDLRAAELAAAFDPTAARTVRRIAGRVRSAVVLAGVAATALVIGFSVAFLAVPLERFSAHSSYTLTPRAATGASFSYATDIRTRTAFYTTYAGIVQGSILAPDVVAVADPVRGVIDLTAVGDAADTVAAELRAAQAQAQESLAAPAADSGYALREISPLSVTVSRDAAVSTVLVVSGAAAAVLALGVTGIPALVRCRRPAGR